MYLVKVPAGLSGFFAPHITNELATTGAIGGGLVLDEGVLVELNVVSSASRETLVENYINGSRVESCIANYVTAKIFREAGVDSYRVIVKQLVRVPIGGGYGTSAASALAIAVALAKALGIRRTLKWIAEVAHEADIVCKTGLGTVVGILNQGYGIVIVKRPGGPFYTNVDHVLLDNSITAFTAFYKPISKAELLSQHDLLSSVRSIGLSTLKKIVRDPCPENFMKSCLEFSLKTGLLQGKLRNIVLEVNKLRGVIGASMNMIGEGLYGLVEKEYLDQVIDYVKSTAPSWIYSWRPAKCLEIYVGRGMQ
ncbi:MAG: hypothetical protein N3E36_00135 [Sulfolobales archaeon]|nr:hypothetical protein [Sulfolobales archaeon]MCX8198436.1 hypothetical protein [Sulfolobales archaeon]MDW8169510.1 hypothetical protein [Desulfurococcaceae archaeon]